MALDQFYLLAIYIGLFYFIFHDEFYILIHLLKTMYAISSLNLRISKLHLNYLIFIIFSIE
jgi:hypothetical protein